PNQPRVRQLLEHGLCDEARTDPEIEDCTVVDRSSGKQGEQQLLLLGACWKVPPAARVPGLRLLCPLPQMHEATIASRRTHSAGASDRPALASPGVQHVEEHVELRAFRGTRRTSVYRAHVLSESAFSRILAAGAGRGLTVLSSLDAHRRHELDKARAEQLAKEATDLRI